MDDRYTLRWNSFHSNILSSFQELLDTPTFHDISLICSKPLSQSKSSVANPSQDNPSNQSSSYVKFKAHKLILSASSLFFKDVISNMPESGNGGNTACAIYLNNISPTSLKYALDFMYCGEINVDPDHIDDFIDIADKLSIKGLTRNSDAHDCSSTDPTTLTATSYKPNLDCSALLDEDVISEKNDSDVGQTASEDHEQLTSTDDLLTFVKSEEGGEDVDDLTTQSLTTDLLNDDTDFQPPPKNKKASCSRPSVFMSQCLAETKAIIDDNSTRNGNTDYFCKLCRMPFSFYASMRRHFLEKHIQNEFSYRCPVCSKVMNIKRNFQSHLQKLHPDLNVTDLNVFCVKNRQ